MERLSMEELVAFVDGQCTEGVADSVREELRRDPDARVALAKLQVLRSRIQPDVLRPTGNHNLSRNVLLRIDTPPPRFRTFTWVLMVALGLAVLVFATVQWQAWQDAQNARTQTLDGAQHVGLEVRARDVVGRARTLVNGAGLQDGDTLTFTLFNRGTHPVFAMLLTVDADDDVQWIYPAEGETTRALPVDAAGVTVGNTVTLQDLVPGTLQVMAWYTESPRSTQDADLLLQAGGIESLRHAPGTVALQVVRAEVPDNGDEGDDE